MDDFYEWQEREEEEYWMEPDSCDYGSFGSPQLGTEWCDFMCPMRVSCHAIFDDRKDCVLRGLNDIPDCYFFHMGSCYIDQCNYTPSRLKQFFIRVKCRLGVLPENPYRRRYEE